ncbi:hypothetical protein M407DRAFT_243346 [Tulasnella calospora MUT 4182]|uniref:Uncharacterized protein n=1 Tax=Tulasnella calospora MUT 4182 TaxID=1051891 RepID=A0A0C3QLC9_9AGAM|nr:hypothetical protein M407DRAFT_243346 [Tulasnella calospora MUT 4182]
MTPLSPMFGGPVRSGGSNSNPPILLGNPRVPIRPRGAATTPRRSQAGSFWGF